MFWFVASPQIRLSTKHSNLVSAKGPAQDDFDTLFSNLEPDPPGALDDVQDMDNMPLEDEPKQVREDLDTVIRSRSRQRPPTERRPRRRMEARRL
jgi:hypothetical protein